MKGSIKLAIATTLGIITTIVVYHWDTVDIWIFEVLKFISGVVGVALALLFITSCVIADSTPHEEWLKSEDRIKWLCFPRWLWFGVICIGNWADKHLTD